VSFLVSPSGPFCILDAFFQDQPDPVKKQGKVLLRTTLDITVRRAGKRQKGPEDHPRTSRTYRAGTTPDMRTGYWPRTFHTRTRRTLIFLALFTTWIGMVVGVPHSQRVALVQSKRETGSKETSLSFSPQPQYITLTPPMRQMQKPLQPEAGSSWGSPYLYSGHAAGRGPRKRRQERRREQGHHNNHSPGMAVDSIAQDWEDWEDWVAWKQQFGRQVRERKRRCHTEGRRGCLAGKGNDRGKP